MGQNGANLSKIVRKMLLVSFAFLTVDVSNKNGKLDKILKLLDLHFLKTRMVSVIFEIDICAFIFNTLVAFALAAGSQVK